MTKREYIERLAQALKTVKNSERDRYLAYFTELIEDKMEEGRSEEEAVAGLENVDAAAFRILAEAREQGNIKKSISAGAVVSIVLGSLLLVFFAAFTLFRLFGYVPGSFLSGRQPAGSPESAPLASPVLGTDYISYEASFANDGRAFHLELIVSHIEIKPSSDDDFHLTYYVSGDHPLRLTETGSSVTLEDTRRNLHTDIELSTLFSDIFSKTPEYVVTLLVPENSSGKLSLATVSGSIMLYGTDIDNDLSIANVSGSITIDSVSCRKLFVAAVSGNSDISGLTADRLDIAATSGGVELGNVTAAKISAANVSGDIVIYNVSFNSLDCGTVSGDLEGELLGSPEDYRVSFASVSGRNSLSGISRGSISIEFASVSGNLELKFAG